jgi:hypothetical protein
MIDVLLYILAAWGYLVLWFFAVGTYLRMEKDHSLRGIPRFIYWSLYTMLVPGVILDFLFNMVVLRNHRPYTTRRGSAKAMGQPNNTV